jgi:DNA-binding transcriptional LysR family regulator
VRLNLTVHNREDLLVQLADNLTDLAVMVRPPQDADTISEPFAPHPYVIVAPPGHALASQRHLTLAQVVREPFIVREKGSDTWQSMADGLGRQMERLNVAMEIRSTETIKQAVLAGMGISFLSAHTVSRELRDGTLVMLNVQGFPLMLNWYVVQRRGKRLPPVAQAFRAFLLTEGARLIREVDPLPRVVRRRSAAKRRAPAR